MGFGSMCAVSQDEILAAEREPRLGPAAFDAYDATQHLHADRRHTFLQRRQENFHLNARCGRWPLYAGDKHSGCTHVTGHAFTGSSIALFLPREERPCGNAVASKASRVQSHHLLHHWALFPVAMDSDAAVNFPVTLAHRVENIYAGCPKEHSHTGTEGPCGVGTFVQGEERPMAMGTNFSTLLMERLLYLRDTVGLGAIYRAYPWGRGAALRAIRLLCGNDGRLYSDRKKARLT